MTRPSSRTASASVSQRHGDRQARAPTYQRRPRGSSHTGRRPGPAAAEAGAGGAPGDPSAGSRRRARGRLAGPAPGHRVQRPTRTRRWAVPRAAAPRRAAPRVDGLRRAAPPPRPGPSAPRAKHRTAASPRAATPTRRPPVAPRRSRAARRRATRDRRPPRRAWAARRRTRCPRAPRPASPRRSGRSRARPSRRRSASRSSLASSAGRSSSSPMTAPHALVVRLEPAGQQLERAVVGDARQPADGRRQLAHARRGLRVRRLGRQQPLVDLPARRQPAGHVRLAGRVELPRPSRRARSATARSRPSPSDATRMPTVAGRSAGTVAHTASKISTCIRCATRSRTNASGQPWPSSPVRRVSPVRGCPNDSISARRSRNRTSGCRPAPPAASAHTRRAGAAIRPAAPPPATSATSVRGDGSDPSSFSASSSASVAAMSSSGTISSSRTGRSVSADAVRERERIRGRRAA